LLLLYLAALNDTEGIGEIGEAGALSGATPKEPSGAATDDGEQGCEAVEVAIAAVEGINEAAIQLTTDIESRDAGKIFDSMLFYTRFLETNTPKITRFGGDVGNLTEAEQRRGVAIIPGIFTNLYRPELANRSLQELAKIMSKALGSEVTLQPIPTLDSPTLNIIQSLIPSQLSRIFGEGEEEAASTQGLGAGELDAIIKDLQ